MSSSIGHRLKQAREAQHISIRKASEATRIRVSFLQSLENGDLSVLPSPVQARGFLRIYAEFLGLDFGKLLADLRSEAEAPERLIGPMDDVELSGSVTPAPQSSELPTKRRYKKHESVDDVSPALKSQSQPNAESVFEPGSEPAVEPSSASPFESPPGEDLWQNWLDRIRPLLTSISRQTEPSTEVQAGSAPETSVNAQPSEEVQKEPSSQQPPQSSKEIFAKIGVELRERREMLSLHLDEVERSTRVKVHYLQALERGDFDGLPSTVQTRGMLANYAGFLDLNVDMLLLRFADALQARHRERNPQKPARKPGQPIIPANVPPAHSFIAGDLIFGVGMAILLVGFSIWGVSRIVAVREERSVQPTAPSISDVLLSTPDPSQFTATSTFLSAENLSKESTATVELPTQAADVNVQINIVVVERTFVRVKVDGKVVFEGRVVPGNAYPFDAQDQVEILAGSGAALRIVYNGRDLGLMGDFGQVVNNIYTAEEIITPTALPTATTTSTLRPTSTIPPTSTLRPTSTPVPSRTSAP